MGKKAISSKKEKQLRQEKHSDIKDDKLNNIKSNDLGDRPLKVVQPFRHRREKTSEFLSRGQKKRLSKKAKMYNRSELIKKLEIKGLRNPVSVVKQKVIKKAEEKQFLFNKLDDELMNLINKEINTINNPGGNTQNTHTQKIHPKGKESVKNCSKITSNSSIYATKNSHISNSKNKKHKLNKLIDEEKEKILSVLQNPTFQSNPIEAVKNHIAQTQMINEKNLQSNKNFVKYMSEINQSK